MCKKIIKTTFFSLALLLISGISHANTTAVDNYTSQMQELLEDLDSSKTLEQLLDRRVEFERMSKMYPSEWLPKYYVIYSILRYIYNSSDVTANLSYLDSVKNKIEELKKEKRADQSEVKTLEGYCYTAIIYQDPKAFGRQYSKTVIRCYEKALEINNKNPRAIILLAFFEQQIPKFLRTKRKQQEEIEKARALFEQEERNIYTPYWGAYYLTVFK